MPLTIGDSAPDFEAQTSEGPISFHDWLGDWGVLSRTPRSPRSAPPNWATWRPSSRSSTAAA